MEPFGGVRFGMQREQAVARLREWARREGEDVAVKVHEDEFGGGSVYLEGAEWTFSCSYDCYDVVVSRVGMWRRRPAGREVSVAWIAERVAMYGPPECVALLVPTASRPVQAIVEWAAAGGCLGVSLQVGDDGEWDVREDLDAHPRPRTGVVTLREHREALARLGGRLGGRGEHGGWSGEFLAAMERWVRARAEVLGRLALLLSGVPVWDGVDTVAEATRALDTIEGGLPQCDGVFVVIRAPVEPGFEALRHRLRTQAQAAGLRVVQLTWRPGFDREPTTKEPLPAPPEAHVEFVEGPLAARLLNDEWARGVAPGLGCEVVPASFVTVEGAVEEWLRVPPASDSPWSRKYAFVATRMWPLRLTDPASGRSVHFNTGGSREELLRHAHALLAALR